MAKKKRCESLNIAVNIEFLSNKDKVAKMSDDEIHNAIQANINTNISMTRGLSMDYRESLRDIMKRSNMNFTDIANETFRENDYLISPDAVGNIINGKANPKPGSLILICCALRLPYNVSMDILRKANCMPSYYNWDAKKQEYDDAYAYVDQIMQATAGQRAAVFLGYIDEFGIKIESKTLNFHF